MAQYSPLGSGIFKVGFIAAFATKLSDTFASEARPPPRPLRRRALLLRKLASTRAHRLFTSLW